LVRFFAYRYEKYKADDGTPRHAIVGYSTVYEYYAYPDKKRPRISQFLVLPPFQRRGLGAQLLHSVYRYYQTCPSVVDITVEDPSDEFMKLRFYVDACLCRKLDSFSAEKLKQGFSKEMLSEACTKYKFSAVSLNLQIIPD
jgi:histone acetyltransferase 1